MKIIRLHMRLSISSVEEATRDAEISNLSDDTNLYLVKIDCKKTTQISSVIHRIRTYTVIRIHTVVLLSCPYFRNLEREIF